MCDTLQLPARSQMHDNLKDAHKAARLSEAQYGFFVVWVTTALLGLILLVIGLSDIGGVLLMMPLPIALFKLMRDNIKRTQYREEQMRMHRATKADER